MVTVKGQMGNWHSLVMLVNKNEKRRLQLNIPTVYDVRQAFYIYMYLFVPIRYLH